MSGLVCPKRVMEMLCAVANARYALEYWEREARYGSGAGGEMPDWAVGPIQRGQQECKTLLAIENDLRAVALKENDRG